MIFSSPIKGLKARQMIARGEAPGSLAKDCQALKGRNKIVLGRIASQICVALTGLDRFGCVEPRALPWAIILRPYRAAESGGAR